MHDQHKNKGVRSLLSTVLNFRNLAKNTLSTEELNKREVLSIKLESNENIDILKPFVNIYACLSRLYTQPSTRLVYLIV